MERSGNHVQETARYHTKITEWPHEERPREKLLHAGPESLSDAELLAILIRTGVQQVTAVDLAKTLLTEFRSIEDLATRSLQELRQYKGLGGAKAVGIVAAFELGRRASARRGADRPRISSPEDVLRSYQSLLRDLQHEIFKVLLLDSGNRLLRDVTISSGTLNSSLVHPREVFRPAILEPAASIILLHNHPSGNPEPSAEDIQITRQLFDASKIIGIPIHDHIIIAIEKYASFAERGLL